MGSFSSAFLLARGYSNSEIGVILAAASIVSVIIQPFLADFADRSKRFTTSNVIEMTVVFSMVTVGGLIVFTQKSPALWLAFAVATAVLMAMQPLMNALPTQMEETGHHINFGMCRAGGSLGYSILTALLGVWVTRFGEGILPLASEATLILLLGVLFAIGIGVKKEVRAKAIENGQKNISVKSEKQDINLAWFMKKNKLFVVLNIGVIFVFFQNYIANNFMLQIVEDVGGNAADMGKIFSVMAFVEIPTMFFYDNIRKKFSCEFLLKVAILSFIIKFVIMYLAKSVTMIYVAQLFQITSFGLFLPAMVQFTNMAMEKGEEVKGQALYTACVTASSIFASVTGGIMLDMAGAKFMVAVATVVTALGAVICFPVIDKIKK